MNHAQGPALLHLPRAIWVGVVAQPGEVSLRHVNCVVRSLTQLQRGYDVRKTRDAV